MFQRRHYIAIAEVLREGITEGYYGAGDCCHESLARLAQDFATILKADNPNFCATRFFEACGIAEEDN